MEIRAHLTRHAEILPYDKTRFSIAVVGAGAIGSWTVLQLAKMGFDNITVYDDDMVTIENMSSQFYRFKDVGHMKVNALKDLVKEFTEVEVKLMAFRYEKGSAIGLADVVVTAVDSMKSRQEVYEGHMYAINTRAIIDPRMAAEEASLYVYNPTDEKQRDEYSRSLYSDENAVQETCTAKSTVYTANMLSGLVVKAIKDIALEGEYLKTALWSIKNNDFKAWTGGTHV